MKFENSISMFIFTIIVSLYLFFISNISTIRFINYYGEIVAITTFSISLIGLFFSSLKIPKSNSYLYYILLFITSIIIIIFKFVFSEISQITKYYFVLAILIALMLSLLDLKYFLMNKNRIYKKYDATIHHLNVEIQRLNGELTTCHELNQSYNNEITKKVDSMRALKISLADAKKEIESLKRENKKSEKLNTELNEQIKNLKDINKNLSNKTKKISEINKEQEKLKRKLSKTEAEVTRQVELKSKYSKTISSIRRKKKEEQELLVVSEDASSVHRPKCMAVRNIPKENRKLIKNWKLAKKEGYKGCKLCKPHIKPAIIIKNGIKYKFIGTKTSDKVHKISCVLTKNIDKKEMIYFKTYKEAIKKKYTACRVCNPEH